LTRSVGKREAATRLLGSQGNADSEEVRKVRRTLTILLLVAVVALSAAGCAGEGGDEGAAAAGPATAAPVTTAASSGGSAGGGGGRGGYDGGYGDRSEPTSSRGIRSGDADTDDVRIEGFAFAPKTIAAKVGQRIKWEHQDLGVTHTVTADQAAFRSGELEEGDEFSHLFRTAGTYNYHCAIHTDMRGTVKVSG
jgi:plastocyanin